AVIVAVTTHVVSRCKNKRRPNPCDTCLFFFFNDPGPTEIYPLSLHDALPILVAASAGACDPDPLAVDLRPGPQVVDGPRSEEHTSELQSRPHLVCRLLLE